MIQRITAIATSRSKRLSTQLNFVLHGLSSFLLPTVAGKQQTANGIQLASRTILNQDKRVEEHSTPQPWFATNAKSRTTVTRSAVLWIEVWNAIQLPPDAPDWSSEE